MVSFSSLARIVSSSVNTDSILRFTLGVSIPKPLLFFVDFFLGAAFLAATGFVFLLEVAFFVFAFEVGAFLLAGAFLAGGFLAVDLRFCMAISTEINQVLSK